MNIEKRRQFIINFVFFAIVAGILYFTMNYLLNWLMPFVIGFAIAYLMNPLITWTVKKTRLKRRLVAYVYTITLAAVIGLLVWLFVYLVIRYTQTYFYLLPDFMNNDLLPTLDKLNHWVNDFISGFSPDIKFQLGKIQIQIYEELQKFAITFSKNGLVFLTNITRSLPYIMITFIFTVLATIFSNIDYPGVKDFIMDTMPGKFRILVKNIRVAFKETVGKYLIAYFKIMSITFIELGIGLSILKVPNALVIAFLIAIFDILPVLGTGGILFPWAAISLILGNFQLGIGILILYGVIFLVRQFIEPKIVGDQLGLNPLVTLISIYLGYIWFGVAGMLLIPISANILIRLYNEGKLSSFINFEELYFDEEDREERRKKKKHRHEQALKEKNDNIDKK